jgi:Zn-dependent protease
LRILGISVFLPPSSVFGLALIAWFAIPASTEALAAGASDAVILIVALVHAVMLYLSVLVHEMGHALSARRRGYPVDGVSLTIIGGHTLIAAEYRRPRDQFWVALAGPVGTLLVAVAAWLGTLAVDGLVDSILGWLAWSSLLIGGVNLLPGIPLDGGAIIDAVVWSRSGKRWRGRQVSAILGLGVAVLWAVTPWILARMFGRPVESADLLVSGLVGFWMASIAWRVYGYALAERDGLTTAPASKDETGSATEAAITPSPVVNIRPYVRRAISVDSSETLGQALTDANSGSAGAIIVTKNDQVIGVVRDAAVAVVPEQLRATTSVTSVARRIQPDEFIGVDTVLSDLTVQLLDPSIHEWVVLDTEGAIYGVLLKSDIQGKLNV